MRRARFAVAYGLWRFFRWRLSGQQQRCYTVQLFTPSMLVATPRRGVFLLLAILHLMFLPPDIFADAARCLIAYQPCRHVVALISPCCANRYTMFYRFIFLPLIFRRDLLTPFADAHLFAISPTRVFSPGECAE